MYEIPQERSILLRIRLVSLLLLLALLLPGCAAGQQTSSAIAATTAPVAEFAEAIVQGSGLSVTRIITDSVSCLHDYSLSVRQMEAVERCDVLLLSGAGLEDFMADVIAQAPKTIDCSEGIALLANDEESDPHIWLDPTRAAQMAANIADGLTELYPDHAGLFADNLQTLTQRLTQLQADGEAALGQLKTRELITFHDGFGYLADAFDLTILAAIEEEAGSEASAADLTEIIALVEQHQIPAVFTEANGSDAAASVIEAETGVPHFSLDMGFGDRDYFDAMTYNLETLKEALS